MRAIAAGLLVVSVVQRPLLAQERDRSLERIRVALQQPAPLVEGLVPPADVTAPPIRFGPFTLVPPTGRGEIIRVSLPIGELVMKAFKGLAEANQRREEAAARRRVAEALREFIEGQPPRQ